MTLNQNNKSFTLIELLVVIAIIGVLSAIVITSISGAVTKSRIVRLQVFSDTIRAQLSDSLVSYWSFNEGTGTTAYDQWEGNNGTLVGDPEWKSGGECVSGKCLEFDGDDYVGFSNLTVDLDAGYYISFWAKANSFPGTTYIGLVGNISDSWAKAIYFNANGSSITGETNTNSENFAFTGSFGSFNTGEWYYIAVTGEAGSYRTYINGIEVHEYTNGSKNDLTINSIGKMGTRDSFNGLIDEVHIYNSAASITQIQSQYLAGLDKLLSNGVISKQEYNQRIKKLSKNKI